MVVTGSSGVLHRRGRGTDLAREETTTMSKADAETMERTALRAALIRMAAVMGQEFGQALALALVCLLLGGVATWVLFQVAIARTAGFWYLTSSYVAFGVGAAALAGVWVLVRLFRFVGRKAISEEAEGDG